MSKEPKTINFDNLPDDLREMIGDALSEMEEKAKHYIEVTFPLIEGIFKTLPISYYAGRDINTSLSPTSEASYYNWRNDEIVVSALSIGSMMEHMKESDDIEMNIRSCLYHEISHVLLTPNNFFGNYRDHEADALNVFEDERIETLFWDKYYGVDFKKSIIQLNNFHGEPPENAFSAFYDIVRFRNAKVTGLSENYLTDVVNMITKYAKITSKTISNYWENNQVDSYRSDIISLYKKIAKDWLEKNKHDALEQVQPNYDESSNSAQMNAVDKVLSQEAKERKKNGTQKAGEGQAVQVEIDDNYYDGTTCVRTSTASNSSKTMESGKMQDNKICEESNEATKAQTEAANELNKNRPHLSPSESKADIKPQEMLQTIVNKFIDNDLTNQFKDIIDNFLSRNKNNAVAVERYSGVLNPRSLTRDDWRIFTYKSTTGPIKGYDKLHLNLFIDTSGSYKNNQDATNTILKSLDTLEKQYPFFSFDLVTCQVSETKRSKNERFVIASGGNYLDNKVWDIFKSLQDPQSLNYNIALFDGDAFTDCRGRAEDAFKNFGVFNSSKCSIISDSDNKRYIEKYAPQSHKIIVGDGGRHRTYSSLLFENIILAMRRALL